MTMTAVYRIALLPAADEQKFVKHMTTVVFKAPGALLAHSDYHGFDHRLLKINGDLETYTNIEVGQTAGA